MAQRATIESVEHSIAVGTGQLLRASGNSFCLKRTCQNGRRSGTVGGRRQETEEIRCTGVVRSTLPAKGLAQRSPSAGFKQIYLDRKVLMRSLCISVQVQGAVLHRFWG